MSVFGGSSSNQGLSFDVGSGQLSLVNSANTTVTIPTIANAITNPMATDLDAGTKVFYNAGGMQSDGNLNAATLTASQVSTGDLIEFYQGTSETLIPANLRLRAYIDGSSNVTIASGTTLCQTLSQNGLVNIPTLTAANLSSTTGTVTTVKTNELDLGTNGAVLTSLTSQGSHGEPIGSVVSNKDVSATNLYCGGLNVYNSGGVNVRTANNSVYTLTATNADAAIRTSNTVSGTVGYLLDSKVNSPTLTLNGNILSLNAFDPSGSGRQSLSSVTLAGSSGSVYFDSGTRYMSDFGTFAWYGNVQNVFFIKLVFPASYLQNIPAGNYCVYYTLINKSQIVTSLNSNVLVNMYTNGNQFNLAAPYWNQHPVGLSQLSQGFVGWFTSGSMVVAYDGVALNMDVTWLNWNQNNTPQYYFRVVLKQL